MTKLNRIITAAIFCTLTALMAACGNKAAYKSPAESQTKHHTTAPKAQKAHTLWGNDPKNAEAILTKEETLCAKDPTLQMRTYKNPDGSTTKTVWSSPAATLYYSMYSPNGNLRLVATAYSEMGDIGGILVDYDNKGRVSKLSVLATLGDKGFSTLYEDKLDKAHDIFKEWITRPNAVAESYPIRRDNNGSITSVGDIAIRSGYTAKVYLNEWGPFWTSDLEGGNIGIFTLQKYQGDMSGSHVDYLYESGRLIAELAYWKTTFIKARTYNRHGIMVKKYDNRNVNIEEQAFYDKDIDPLWYADNSD